MKKTLFIIYFMLTFCQISANQNVRNNLANYLPKAGELKHWQPENKPEIYIGDDLYIFINGGAEIYHEYGFNRVVYQEFKDNNKNSINVEIYEMKSPQSAFGIYSFKIGPKGKAYPVGNDAFLQSYYMNFWKGNYLIILTGFDENDATINGIKTIAKVIDKKIKTNGEKPELVNLLPKQNLQTTQIKYLKGVLALFNQYNFGAGNIFGISEAVIGTYENHRLFIFKYGNEKESLKFFKNAANQFPLNSQFSEVIIKNSIISMRDQKGSYLSIKLFQKYILILLAKKELDNENRFDFIQKHIISIGN